jgi:exodeoxyribonuclease VII small subunit
MEFEDAMARLEKIVAELETGDLRLGQALALYEEGVAMAKMAADLLDQAEARVEVLLADGRTEPFAPGEAASGG